MRGGKLGPLRISDTPLSECLGKDERTHKFRASGVIKGSGSGMEVSESEWE